MSRRAGETLAHWQRDPDLAPVRDEGELKKLPAAKQAEWRKLWAELADLRTRAEATPRSKQGKKPEARFLGPAEVAELLRQAEADDRAGRWSKAAEALAVLKLMQGRDKPGTLGVMRQVADYLRRAGRWAESEAVEAEHLEVTAAKHGPDHPEALLASHRVAMLRLTAGREREAVALFEPLLDKQKVNPGPGHPQTINTMSALGQAYHFVGRLDDADRMSREALALRRKQPGANPQDSRGELANLGMNLLAQGRYADAEPVLRAVRLFEAGDVPEWQRCRARNLLGAALAGLGRAGEAEPLLVGGHEGMRKMEAQIPAPWRRYLRAAGERVVRFYESTDRPDKAREWREKLPPEVAPPPRAK
jgi:Flp pilus assembly protein TadD